jgi:rhamnose utilization protein RhaD (predicted bifunctional aldolase and dehydrogenase)/NAD(P)-dependent dehydrogenase (short-subunit alcohol dehydrogenase family)
VTTVAAADDVELLAARSRRLGQDPALVIHGGGNTSTKGTIVDHLGRERRVLHVKASGASLATATRDDFVSLYLDDLLELRARDSMTDDELVLFLERAQAMPSAKRASVETPLHAFLDARPVDHVHSDAICALSNAPDCEAVIAEALGDDVVVVPYVRPGFGLAKLLDGHESATAIVLLHHGLVTAGETHDGSVERTLELEACAREYLARRCGVDAHDVASPAAHELVDLLPRLRGAVSQTRRYVLHVDRSQRRIADREDVDRVAAVRSTPDHMLRIGRSTAVLRRDTWADDLAAADELRVALVPGVGCIAVGQTAAEARRRAEMAAHTHASVAQTLSAFGAIEWLSDDEIREFVEWPLELAKLGSASGRELDGRIVIVTGAASGIGREAALTLGRAGAALVLADLDGAGVEETATAVGTDAAVAVEADVTAAADVARVIETAVLSFGGVDGIVSNAGVAVTGRLAELDPDEWQRSLAVNATSHFLLTRSVLPILEAQATGGSLVYVASKNAFSPGAGFGAYSAAKAAEIQIARIAALEGGPIGVRANAINPDAIFSGSRLWSEEMRRERAAEHGVEPDELEAFYARRNLLKREVSASDVAEAVQFLVSDRSAATTGCVLTVDGGVAGAFPR